MLQVSWVNMYVYDTHHETTEILRTLTVVNQCNHSICHLGSIFVMSSVARDISVLATKIKCWRRCPRPKDCKYEPRIWQHKFVCVIAVYMAFPVSVPIYYENIPPNAIPLSIFLIEP